MRLDPAIPTFLRIPQAERNAAWSGFKLTSPSFVPHQSTDMQEKQRVQDRLDALACIDRMKSQQQRKKSNDAIVRKLHLDPGLSRADYFRILLECKEVGEQAVMYFTRTWHKCDDGRYRKSTPTDHRVYYTPDFVVDYKRSSAPRRVNVDDVSARLAGVTRPALAELARRNGIWKDDYDKLDNGRFRMVVGNRLRAMVKKGEAVTWASCS